MKILVIPDVHLKPWMFERASEILKEGKAEKAVCLMDIADDWMQQYNLDAYIDTYNRAIRFAEDYPDTLWCYGNHDVCYQWNMRESGYSPIAAYTVNEKLEKLKRTVPDPKQIGFIHQIDNVLLLHGGLTDQFVREYIPSKYYNDVEKVIEMINGFSYPELWNDLSPLWYRPLYQMRMYKPRKLLQIVGHTPVKKIIRVGNLISCDVFSTDRDRNPIGKQRFLIIDTENWEMSILS